MASRIEVSARVRLEIELISSQSWPPDVSMDQIHKEAAEWAVNVLHSQIGHHAGTKLSARIVGQPSVTAVLVEKKS